MAEIIRLSAWDGPGVLEAAEYLKENLPDGWTVVFGRRISSAYGPSVDTDFVVLGPQSLTVLEVKHWRRISGNENEWKDENGRTAKSALFQADLQARRLKGALAEVLEAQDQRWFIDYFVLLTHPHVRVIDLTDKQYKTKLLSFQDCSSKLMARDQVESRTVGGRFVNQNRDRIRTWLDTRLTLPEPPPPIPIREINRAEYEDHVSRFCGRGSVIEDLRRFLQGHPGEYLVLTGPPGVGKSALASKLFSTTPVNWASVLHLARSERRFPRVIEAIAREVERLIGASPEEQIRMDLDSHLRTFQTLDSRPLMVILDGLDEIEDFDAEQLPANLPRSVRVVLTLRPDPRQVERLRARLSRASFRSIDPLDRVDGELLLEKRLEPPRLRELLLHPSWPELSAWAAGYPLWLHAIAGVIGPDDRGDPECLLPVVQQRGWSRTLLDQVAPTRSALGLRILRILAVARRPLRQETLHSILSLEGTCDWEEFRDELSALGPVLLQYNGTKCERYQIHHQSFTDFLRDELMGPTGIKSQHQLLARWAAASPDEDYALDGRLYHLVKAEETKEALDLLLDVEYLDRRCAAHQVQDLLLEVRELERLLVTEESDQVRDKMAWIEKKRFSRELSEWARRGKPVSRRDPFDAIRGLPEPPSTGRALSLLRTGRKLGATSVHLGQRTRDLLEFLEEYSVLLDAAPKKFLQVAAVFGPARLARLSEEALRRGGGLWFRRTGGSTLQPAGNERLVGRHPSDIHAVAASADLKTAITCDEGGIIRAWDVERGAALGEATLSDTGALEPDPHSLMLAASADASVIAIAVKSSHPEPAFSGVLLWSWSLTDGFALIKAFPFESPWRLRLSADGAYCAVVGGPAQTWIIPVSSSDEPFRVENLPIWARLASWGGDRFIEHSEQGLVVLERGRPREVPFDGVITGLSATPNLRMACVKDDDDDSIQFLDVQRGSHLGYLQASHAVPAPGDCKMVLSPDGLEMLLATGSSLALLSVPNRVAKDPPRRAPACRISHSPTKDYLVIREADSITVRSLQNGKRVGSRITVAPPADLSSWSPLLSFREQVLVEKQGLHLVFCDGPDRFQLVDDEFPNLGKKWLRFRTIDLEAGTELEESPQFDDEYGALGADEAGRFLFCTNKGTIIWDWKTGTARKTQVYNVGWIDPRGTIGVARDDSKGTLIVWDLSSGVPSGSYSGHSEPVVACSFTGRGTALTVDETGVLKEWDPKSGEEISSSRLVGRRHRKPREVPGTSIVMTVEIDQESLFAWDIEDEKHVGSLPFPETVMELTPVSPSGHFAVRTLFNNVLCFRVEGAAAYERQESTEPGQRDIIA